jgi:hypothetical protein
VDFDVAALEPTVLAELSQDETLIKLYGPQAKLGQDIYLFNACHMPRLGDKVRKYYDPENPTPETTKIAKEKCKVERGVSKTVTLASQYGASPARIKQTLDLENVKMSFKEVEEIHRAYWELYNGVKVYQAKLLDEWEGHGGWVFNGLGRPLTVSPDSTKDLLNRVCQSTGHDILLILLYYLDRLRFQSNVDFYFVFSDWHDETIVECSEKDGEKVLGFLHKALELTNQELQGSIRIRGNPKLCSTLWEAKE